MKTPVGSYKNYNHDTYTPDIDGPLADVAQGVINIDSGITSIEPDSRVYRGMLALIKLRQEGRLFLKEELEKE